MLTAAFFDFDGTLYAGHLWKDMSDYFRERRERAGLLWVYLLGHMALWPLNLVGVLSHERFYGSWARDLTWVLRGLSVGEGQALFRFLLEWRILPGLRPDVVERLRYHQREGHVVMLVSGGFRELLEMLAAELGVLHVVGTEAEVRDGVYTGRAVGLAITGRGKVEGIRNLAAREGLDLDWANSYAYADSRTDIPLLEVVGHPVAVYPDKALAAHAQARGWEVLGTPEEKR
ncbi:MAG: HAD family hydrolase [Anaerolineae bacterium]|nr:HAD family hydrolase [Anaerolineae bacterium]